MKSIVLSEDLIKEGKVNLMPFKVLEGMESIPRALEKLRGWKRNATMLVCVV